MAKDVRAKLTTSKLPVSFCWYHLKSSTDVSSLIPIREEPNHTPWFKFTGVVPSCAGVRPIGCRVFPKIYLQPNKLSPQSIPCIIMPWTRTQPAWTHVPRPSVETDLRLPARAIHRNDLSRTDSTLAT
eukprot:4046136-Pleurochrysis_carterae.AAC.1